VIIRPGREDDTAALIALAAQVERWFGPMTGEPGFLAALARHISRGTALIATTGAGTGDGLTTPGTLEVVTFGADHPGASASGARAFYERLGFTPAEAAAPGPEGGSRQAYRKPVA